MRSHTTMLGYSDYVYEDGTDWLVRETWHSAISGNTFDLVRYGYTNGKPSRIEVVVSAPSDLTVAWGYGSFYPVYNWHGDTATYVNAVDGSGGGSWGAYDPWGNPSAWGPPGLGAWDYYRWNGAWGYQWHADLGLYYVHGRWYNQDTGMWLSPDEAGEYRYGSGQDAVNWAWAQMHAIVYFPTYMCDAVIDCEALSDLPSLTGGYGYQLLNDQMLGIPNWVSGTDWQQTRGYAFYKGQQGGRLASEWIGKVLIAHGSATALAGTTFLPPTATAAATCTGTTGICVLPSGVVVLIDLGMIGEGTLEATYGANVLAFADKNPLGNLSAERQRAVREAWKQEKELVEKTGKGSRNWTSAEKKELTQRGRVKGYEGHHINDAHTHPDLAGDPNNIVFVKGRQGNLFEHGGDFHNPTTGPLIDRLRMLKNFLSGTGGP